MFLEEKKQGEVKELDAASQLLLKAAALIERCGHCKNEPRDYKGRFCIYGALGYSAVGDLEYGPARCPEMYVAASRIQRTLNDGVSVVMWNNWPERTAEEVIAKLRAVALSGQC